MKKLILLVITLTFIKVNAQDSLKPNALTFSGYIDTYFSYDASQPDNHERPSFFYSYKKHNEFNLNLGFIKAAYSNDNVRGNLALMTGTYAQYNLSSEHPIFQHILEGSAGVKISKNKNLWLDAGIMPSHIGFESALGKDCWNLTRSILAENSPYFESGIKLGYTSPNEKIYFAGLLLNGWQHIQRLYDNQTPAFGTQLIYKPGSKITLNWSTFIGNEFPHAFRKWRYFNNFYGQFQLNSKLGITTGFDIGTQQKSKGSSNYSIWYSPVLIAKYSVTEKINLVARGEYYQDKDQVIISYATPKGFETFGYSLNFDYILSSNALFRIEGRNLNSKDQIFILNNKKSNNNYFVTTSLSISF